MWENETTSVLVSRTLNHLGYGLSMVRFRQQMEGRFTRSNPPLCYYFKAGSKVEGLAKPLESDSDILGAPMNVLATKRPFTYASAEYLSVFQLAMADTAPGYTRLICQQLGSRRLKVLLKSLMEPMQRNVYLSSDTWREECRRAREVRGMPDFVFSSQSHGPSNPRTGIAGDVDEVCGILCDCPNILQSWIDRPRKNGWPSTQLIRDISTTDAYVVPVGYKRSPCEFLEWRISFVGAEIHLIQSFNDCQIKLLILLKMVAKTCLKPVSKHMTSYLMKNIVMWMSEKLPVDFFSERRLLSLLNISLEMLRRCLMHNELPNFMMPGRNLLADKISSEHRARLCSRILELQGEGPQMLIRCEKIRNSLYLLFKCPETFYTFSEKLLQTEILFHFICRTKNTSTLQVVEDERQQWRDSLVCCLREIVLPDYRELKMRGEDVERVYSERLKLYLS